MLTDQTLQAACELQASPHPKMQPSPPSSGPGPFLTQRHELIVKQGNGDAGLLGAGLVTRAGGRGWVGSCGREIQA